MVYSHTPLTAQLLTVALTLGSVLWSWPVFAQDRVVGLLSLPEVFGRAACDRFTPQSVDLRSSPQGPVIGSIVVVKPWTYHSDGGCEGLEVGVRRGSTPTFEPLPTLEFAYEESGAVVLERRDRWFRVRLADGSAWLQASAQDEFHALEQIFEESLTYLTEVWGGQVSASPGSAGRAAKISRRVDEQTVRVRGASRQNGDLWFLVEIMSHSPCGGGSEPTVVDQGWVPAYGKDAAPAIWFYSRGC